jgi:hypothetical protein
MKKIFALCLALSLAACGNDYPQQPVQYQPQVVQQAPAPAPAPAPAQPVVVQQDNSGTALVAGAALGAVATMALTNRDSGAQAPVQQNITHVTQVNKTVIVNNKTVAPPAPPAAPVASVSTPPVAPAPAAVNLTKAPAETPAAKPTYAVTGTASPTPTMTAAALTAPKTITMPATTSAPSNYKPNNYAPVSYSKPVALPAPKPAMAPAPAKLSYSGPKPLAISYSPGKKK